MNEQNDTLLMPRPIANDEHMLLLKLDGYEGPIDLLLDLARRQKVDLKEISILALSEQYLSFVETAHHLDLDVAADYLVMAAWLAYLKSRLLLPVEETEEGEPSAEMMAEWLAFQLQRLQAMRDMSERLMARTQLGQDRFAGGVAVDEEDVVASAPPEYTADFYQLLKAYANIHGRRVQSSPLAIEEAELYSMDDAIDSLSKWVGRLPKWQNLFEFLPKNLQGRLVQRSALASTFAASLEMVRQRRIELQQNQSFGPIFVRSPEVMQNNG